MTDTRGPPRLRWARASSRHAAAGARAAGGREATRDESANPNDFALVAMLALLGLRIFGATGAEISDLGEEHGHRVLGNMREGHQGRAGPAAPGSRPGDRARHRRPGQRADPAQQPWRPLM